MSGTNGSPKGGLTDVLAPIAPLAAALGALAATGTIGRMQRDHPVPTSIAFGLVVFAAAVWLLGSLPWPGKDTQTVLRAIAAAFFTAGSVVAIVLAIKAAGAEPRPHIEASLSPDRSTVTATVNASNLTSKQRLAILVDALNAGAVHLHLYQAYVGADSDGNVKQTISVRVPNAGVTDIGVKAFTNQLSPKCDDLAPETQPEAEEKSTAGQAKKETPQQEEQKKAKEKQADPGSGTGCVILSVAKP
jgi:hypothetical protein